ncbi:MAG: LLM class flavin-dependent oxidoreductase [Dehalococcoidia bacterium]
MSTPELHFGATLSGGMEQTAEQARRLEELGFECATTGEHFMRGNPPTPTPIGIPVLAVAAGATTRLRVVTGIVLTPLYHPVMLAKLSSTLDVACNGRFTLGVGVGGEFPMEFEAFGVPVKQRGSRTDETLRMVRRLWTEEHVTDEGRYYQLRDVTLNPRPAQRPTRRSGWRTARRGDAPRRPLRRRLDAVLLQPRAVQDERRAHHRLRRRGGARHLRLRLGALRLHFDRRQQGGGGAGGGVAPGRALRLARRHGVADGRVLHPGHGEGLYQADGRVHRRRRPPVRLLLGLRPRGRGPSHGDRLPRDHPLLPALTPRVARPPVSGLETSVTPDLGELRSRIDARRIATRQQLATSRAWASPPLFNASSTS